jgi:hypothetical protein
LNIKTAVIAKGKNEKELYDYDYQEEEAILYFLCSREENNS